MVSIPQQSTSYWVDSTPKTHYHSLKGKISVDVAVIGGGIAGITAAYLLKSSGAKVALIEAKRIANGVTGYTTAKVTSQHHLIYRYLLKKFGVEGAHAYGEANERALEWMASLVETQKINCDFRRKSAYVYTVTEDDLHSIEAEVDAAQQAGLPASFTQKTILPFEIKGAVQFSNQAEFHPRKFLLALVEKLTGGGSHIYEKSRVKDIRDGSPCEILTENGKVIAKHVLIATHFPILDRTLYFARMSAKSSYALMVNVKTPLPDGIFISTERPIHSLRVHPTKKGERLLVVGEDHKTGQGGDTLARYQRLKAFAQKHFEVESIDYRWSTEDYVPHDRVPFIGKFTPWSKNVYVATGFQAWGMTNGIVAAMIFSDLISEKENPWAFLFDPNRLKTFYTKKMFVEIFSNIKNLVNNRLSTGEKKSPAHLAVGEAKLLYYGGKKIAAYKNKEGKVSTVSAVCTHRGCIVQWNNAEETWDCPCHGSFYDSDGTVIHGPALNNLKEIKVKTK